MNPSHHPQDSRVTRRQVVASGLGAYGASVLPAPAGAAEPSPSGPSLRFAHLTDMHVQPQLRGGEGYAAALDSLKRLDPPPQFVVTGGDHVMDVFETSRERADVQYDLYARVLKEHCALPVYPVMGNHDVWGWGQPGQIKPDQPLYGKQMAVERLNMKGPYYSFDEGDWHFICLDNIAPRGAGYFGSLDDEQARWLIGDLEKTGTNRPICVISHIPLLAACVFFDGKERVQDTYWHVPDAWMHRDVKPLINLLRRYNTRLCLSGHIHLVDRVDYLGISFICNGAVCGAWWKGPQQEFAEGYGVIDLWPDGSFAHEYVTYGWKA